MLLSTLNNNFNLGGRSGLTGMTLNLEGIVANFNSTTNNFVNSSTNTFTNLSSNNASFINVSMDNVSITNLSANNISVLSITVNNASTYNISIYNASITNLSASVANIYNVISPNIDANTEQLTIGGTTATSLVLGKATNTTNILGNLKINSDSGTLGQVLTSNGDNTVPTWTTISGVGGGGWVGTALSNLSMGIYSIIGSRLDSSGTNLSLGGTTAESVTLGRATKVTNILGNLQIAGSAGTTGQVLTSNATTAVWSDTSWVGTATSNLSMGTNSIIVSNIDASSTALTIGGVTAQGVTIGKALLDTNILGNFKIAGDAGLINQVLRSNGTTASWGDYGTATANLAMGTYSITGTSLDSATTLALGTTTATTTTLGRTAVGTITNINGSTVNISGTTINLGINTSSTTKINVGTFQFLGDVLGSTINVIDGSTVNVSGVMRIADKLTAGAIRIGSSLTSGDIIIGNHNSTNSAELRTGATLQLGNQATAVNIGATTGTTNTIKLGNTASTTNISGVATNFQATVNTFTNAISAGAIDAAAAAGALLVGATNAVLTLGNTARATTLRGSTLAINLAGSLGSSGQVLTSNGTNATWQTLTGWIGTATSNLDMASYNITNVSNLSVSNNFIFNGNYIYGKLPYIFNSSFTSDATINGTLINMQFFYWIMPQTITARNLFLPTTTYIGQIIIVKNDSTVSHNIHAVSPNTIRANTASASTSIPIASYSSRQLYCANNAANNILWVVISLQ